MWLATLAALSLAQNVISPVRSDEVVVFFPSIGRWDDKNRDWLLQIHGWIYEPEKHDLLRRTTLHHFRERLGLDARAAESAIFHQRASLFLVDNERGKRVPIRIGDRIEVMEPSTPNGHFRGTVRLSQSEVAALLAKPVHAGKDGTETGWITYRAVLPEGDKRVFEVPVHLVPEQGISVISDIDDTIKVSHVGNLPALLTNTFLKEFQPVPGAAKVYQSWHESGAVFHYVSASPWQLYEPLAAFCRANGFPEGVFHLKDFRWKDSTFFNLFASPRETKRNAILPLLDSFPMRQFVLVGDSGERDPEIYAELARERPSLVTMVLILDLSAGANADRFARAFEGLPASKWKVLSNWDDIKLLNLAELD